jgi:hypothetical protein
MGFHLQSRMYQVHRLHRLPFWLLDVEEMAMICWLRQICIKHLVIRKNQSAGSLFGFDYFAYKTEFFKIITF